MQQSNTEQENIIGKIETILITSKRPKESALIMMTKVYLTKIIYLNFKEFN